ncbi:MAG: hypothetical protein JWM93_2932 [Frankiales bacterium]|nr:hypothetical protein [Frankiales bacterium]
MSDPGATPGELRAEAEAAAEARADVGATRRPVDADPPLSVEALMAVGFAALVGLALLFDAWYLAKGKHAICDAWLARGAADCAGSDGFREWGPKFGRDAVILVVLELLLIPLAAYLLGRVVRARRAVRSAG